jgi:hypothetical protein
MNPGALKTVIWFVELGNGTLHAIHPIHRCIMISLPLVRCPECVVPGCFVPAA